ncbi:DUF4153 domain-containing protein [Tenacibaculum tangerinum]|uniref:DUF4153 domain-containing protein n=1 Tax=Tenacibaculum tangerinum TaxID=3038772 RepID=A0ABY8L3D7_9FLAO|nr:DUF4153 domain-containing protein [Tenacibaculum tangerinum]WGH74519.1 DUF4153 domain-containing protein [Tenacibaculum tangerinum]
MKFIPSFGEITSNTKATFKRFPITLTWAIVGTLFTLFAIEKDIFDDAFYGKIILIFVLGVSWLIATRFLVRQFEKDTSWIFLLTFGFLALFYLSIGANDEEIHQNAIIRFILYFIAGHLFVMVAPFIFKWNKDAYFNYLKDAFTAIVRSLFFSLILYLGIVLALLAIKHLFNVDFKGERFFQVFVVCIGIVNTWVYLSDFPKDIYSQLTINYTKALEVLVKYILIPLVILYLIILYAYSLQIVILWNLPKGWVSYLVIALSFLGFIIQILINPIQKKIDSRAIRKFYPWFYYLLLPLIFLLFVAIFRRINDYGITENRYFVLVLACWILAMSLYMLFSKHTKIKVFPLSLTIVALLISFGFWGAFSVSTKSQIKQFEKVYTDIKNDNFTTSFEKKNQLRSIVRYLNNKEELHTIETIVGYNPKTTFKTESHWQLQNRLMDSLAIKVIEKPDDINEVDDNYYSIDEENLTINTKDFDVLKKIVLNNYRTKATINGYTFSLGNQTSVIKVFKEDTLMGEINCAEMIQKLKRQERNYDIAPRLLTIKHRFETLNVKFVFQNIELSKVSSNTEKHLSNINAYILIKEKDAQ